MGKLKRLTKAPSEEYKRQYNALVHSIEQLRKMTATGGVSIHWAAGVPMLVGATPVAGLQAVWFELSETLDVESSAEAFYLDADYVATAETLTVWSTGIRSIAGADGDHGVALLNPLNGRWEVIQLECG